MRYFAAIVIVCILLFAALPYQRIVVPELRFQIQDETGNPQAKIRVKQQWRDWSAESEEHQETILSDSAGYVTFPERLVGTCRLCIFIGAFRQIASQGVHASIGPVAFITAYGDDPHIWTFVQYVPGQFMPASLQLKRWESPIVP